MNSWRLILLALLLASWARAATTEERLAALERQAADLGMGGKEASPTLSLGGHVDVSYLLNLADRNETGPVAGSDPTQTTGRVYDRQYDAFTLNQVKLILEKPRAEGPTGAGFHVEAVLGENANALLGSDALGDSALFIPQAYVELGLPLPWESVLKVGKYYTLVGYEATDACDNPNFSFSEPYRLMPGSHTGLCLEVQWGHWLKSSLGLCNGFDAVLPGTGSGNFDRAPAFNGKVEGTNMETSLGDLVPMITGYWGTDDLGNPPWGDGELCIWTVGGSWKKVMGCQPLSLAAEFLQRFEERTVVPGQRDRIRATAAAVYAGWDWTDWLNTSARFGWSWYRNFEGVGLDPMVVRSGENRPGATEMGNFTLTQNFRVWKDVLLRAEWRRDWTPSSSVGFGVANPNGTGPDDLRSTQDTLAFDVVVSF